MKKNRRQFYGLLCFAILFPGLVISVINPTEPPVDEELQNLIAAFERRQAIAQSQNTDRAAVPERFRTNHNASTLKDDTIINSFERDESGRIIYPEYFGGTFIDSDGILNIFYVEGFKDDALNSFSQLFDLDDVIIKPAKHSYSELVRVVRHLRGYRRTNFDSFALDTMNNRVIVRLNYVDEEQIALFKNTVIDSDVISFVKSRDILLVEPLISYSSLINMVEQINDFKANNHDSEVTKNINSYFLDTKNNRVIIGLDDFSDEQRILFENAFPQSNVMVFLVEGMATSLDVILSHR